MYIIRIVLWSHLIQRARFGLIDALSIFEEKAVGWCNIISSISSSIEWMCAALDVEGVFSLLPKRTPNADLRFSPIPPRASIPAFQPPTFAPSHTVHSTRKTSLHVEAICCAAAMA